jgi:photosystem II stability/assembly factor-like uncharacterized protein
MTRLLLVLLLLTGCSASTVVEPLRNDDPDEAAGYSAAKRAGSEDRFASYAKARAQMHALPRYATESDRFLPSEVEGIAEPRSHGIVSLGADDTPFGKWKFLGPGNVGGRTRVLVIDSATPAVMYSGGVSGGLWKTTDAGKSWAPLGDDLANIAINSLAMHPANHDILYAGTGEGYFREEQRGTALPLRGDGIFVTRDAGATWTQLASTTGADFDFVNDLVVSTHDPSRVYAATRTGVWRSNDEGATWTHVLPATVKGGCLDLAYRNDTSGDYLFASCGTFERATVYRNANAQTDGAWQSVLSQENMGRTTLAIAPSNPSVIYALAASNQPGNYNQALLGVYRSTQSGDPGTWQARITNQSPDYLATLLLTNVYGATNTNCRNSNNTFTTMGWYCNTIAVDPVNENRVWVGGVDAFRSDDGGATWGIASYWWEREDYPTYLHADQHALVFHPQYDGVNNKQLFFANDGGLSRTDNALATPAYGLTSACNPSMSQFSFTTLNNGYGVTQFYHGSVSPDGRMYMGGTQDNGTIIGTIDAGPNEWRHVLGGDGSYTAIDAEVPTTVYGSSQYGNVFRSVNGGAGWRNVRGSLSDDFLFITPFAMDMNKTTRLWIGGRRMWRTEDRGEQWATVSTLLPGQVSAIAVAPRNSSLVLAGTNSGHIVRNADATNAHAQIAWSATQPRAGFVSWIAFDPIDTNTVYATYAGFGGEHLWRSIDAGVTWSAVASNLPDIPVHSIAIDPTRRERLYLGTDLGVFVSLDSGATWSVENTGFANVVTETVIIGQGHFGPAVYAFTHGRGAWRAELVSPGPKRRSVR